MARLFCGLAEQLGQTCFADRLCKTAWADHLWQPRANLPVRPPCKSRCCQMQHVWNPSWMHGCLSTRATGGWGWNEKVMKCGPWMGHTFPPTPSLTSPVQRPQPQAAGTT
eukprot:365899-Chlamydomonas_euryale.AAC.2